MSTITSAVSSGAMVMATGGPCVVAIVIVSSLPRARSYVCVDREYVHCASGGPNVSFSSAISEMESGSASFLLFSVLGRNGMDPFLLFCGRGRNGKDVDSDIVGGCVMLREDGALIASAPAYQCYGV